MTIFQPISKRSIQIRGALTALALVGAVTAATILSPLTVSAQTAVSDPPVDTRMDPRGQTGPIGEQPDLAAAAATLGVTEDALQAALGEPGQGPPDFAAAADELGVTEEALMEALGQTADAPPMGEQPSDQQPTNQQAAQQGMNGQMPDLAAAAETLGVTEEVLQAALGEPGQGPPDFAAAADELGVTEEALMTALGVSDDAPPMGGPGNNQRPSGGQPPAGRP